MFIVKSGSEVLAATFNRNCTVVIKGKVYRSLYLNFEEWMEEYQ